MIRGKGWVYEELCRRGTEPLLLDAKGSFNWRYLARLRKLIKDEQVDLIQSHLLGSNVYCSMAGILTGVPVVATFHGSVDIGETERFKSLKSAIINTGANRIIAVTDSLRDDIITRTPLNRNKIEVIYNGIDTSLYQRSHSNRLRHEYGWSDEEVIIGCLGNIRPAKGYDILLHAAALLRHGNRSYRFVVAGQAKDRLYDELLQLRKQLGLEDRVYFLGFIEDAAEFLSNLDLFLSSSISEGLPLAAIQAMVAKLPIIATRCGGYEGLITDRENGWLVEVGKPGAIADAIDSVMAEPEVQRKLADNAHNYATRTFDIKVMQDAYTELYASLIYPERSWKAEKKT